jgi:hypothetical protein
LSLANLLDDIDKDDYPELSNRREPKKTLRKSKKVQKMEDKNDILVESETVYEARAFYIDSVKIIASPLKMDVKGKALWLASSQVALGMKLIHDLFPSFNILYNAPFFPYNRYDFSFKYLLRQETEENIIKENTFLILNVSDHWILLTNFGCDSGSWHVYDSLYQSSYVFALNKMFNHFNIIFEDNDVFLVTHRDVLRQTGITDCGLFALGFLFALCSGKNPSCIHFKQKEMRSHFKNCMENHVFTQFPHNELFNKSKINDNNYIYDCKTESFEPQIKKYA